MSDDRQVVLIGCGQYTQRDVDLSDAKSPAAMMADCARRAAADCGAGVLNAVDSIAVVNILSWPYANAAGVLGELLGIQPRETIYTTIGGNSPQSLVNAAAKRLIAGEIRMALLAGAEAVSSVRRSQKSGYPLTWPSGGEGTPIRFGDKRSGSNDLEGRYGLHLPVQIYPFFENALRKHYGHSIEEHQRVLGRLYASFSAVAAKNPYAWFQEPRTPEEIATVTSGNRFIGFPYPKLMNAIMDVDQAAAVLVTTVRTARELGVPSARWVYLQGAAEANDNWFVTDRVNYFSSPAIRAAGAAALECAELGIDQIEHFDVYSCFPSAVQIGRDMLGIPVGDERALTVTGGLASFGGPGNNYSMHGIATIMDRVREEPASKGLVTALGWYVTKHAIGIYGTEPPPRLDVVADKEAVQAAVDRIPGPTVVAEPEGVSTVETYTVLYDRDGAPMRGLVVGRLTDERRFLAELPNDRALLESFAAHEGVGRTGRVSTESGLSTFHPD